MPGSLTSADRKLLIAAGAAALLMMGGSLLFMPGPERDRSYLPSSYSSGEHGARAAFLLLSDLHFQVNRWEQPPSGLLDTETLDTDEPALLVLAEPTISPSEQERRWLHEFVRRGNRILFCGASLPSYFPEVKLRFEGRAKQASSEFHPFFPSYISRGAPTVSMKPLFGWDSGFPAHVSIYGRPDFAVVTAWPIGKGELIWWATADPLTNHDLLRENNLQLFLNSVSGPAAAQKPAIFWDEYFHGQRGSLWSYAARTPLRWTALQFLILIAAVLFSRGRTFAATWKPQPQSRLSPLEFVQTLGGLYERAKATSVPVSVAYRDLRLRLSRRLGFQPDVADTVLAGSAHSRLQWDEQELRKLLDRAQRGAEGGRIPKRAALEIVKQLNEFVKRLDPYTEQTKH
jgi:hypothetical protein